MNKFKKLAVAAVSVVMAGTMALSFTACGDDSKGPGKTEKPGDNIGKDLYHIMKPDGTLNYDAYKRTSEVTLSLAVGHNSLTTSTSFRDLGTTITLPDGNSYGDNKFKPAWVQMGKDLNITWKDVFDGVATNSNLNKLTSENQTGSTEKKYAAVDLFTSDLSVVVSKANSGTDILNLAEYLDYMPNFRNFLNENPVVYLSLLQDGMSTSNGSGQKILVAPYFDGYDDIERYCIIRHDWAKKLLNGDTATGSTAKFSEACATTTSATSFMGETAYEVDALTADGKDVQKIKKDYAAALAAAKSESTPLGKAYKAIAGSAYTGDKGNIVDLMNTALAANSNATGAQLVDLFRAYIDVCFTKGGSAYFNKDNRANVFVGYDACWDVDDLVALLRCVKTNASLLVGEGKTLGGLAPRSGQNDRTPDMVSLAGQLYGVRGATSRNEYTYIDKGGNIKDARADEAFYQAMANMNGLMKEGLIANYASKANFATSSGIGTKDSNKGHEYFMVYDYSQTQTLAGFLAEDSKVTHKDFKDGVPEGYDFAPIITPVSKWDVDGNGTIAADEYFRFTESWRSTKTSGLAVNGAVKNNQAKLDAALQFIDYLYSEDGQIVSTYGPMAENAEGKGGFWYNTPASDEQVNAGNYFRYKGVRYSGSDYKGNTTPTITENLYKSFKGESVNGWKPAGTVSGAALSFTNYARMLIGSTLPVGVKDQSFENQLTSKMGQRGAGVVGQALAKGVVKGMSLNVDSNNYWFTCVPTGLPVKKSDQDTLDSTTQLPFRYFTGTGKTNDKGSAEKNFFSIMNSIILNGTSATYNEQDIVVEYSSITNLLNECKLGEKTIKALALERQIVFNTAWTKAKSYWSYLSKPAE